MAIVKVFFKSSTENVVRYVFNHSLPGDPVDSESCPPNAEGAIQEFEAERVHHNAYRGNNEVLHIIQSWGAEESQKLSPHAINAMGRELISDYFKNHQFVIVTHTETGKFHNHIVVNRVNLETGMLIEHKFKHLHKLRAINDRICLSRGLEIPNREPEKARSRLPQRVQNMIRAGRESWVLDLRNKADVSRSLATNYDQYVNYLDAFGIRTRVEEKTITYFYSGRSRGKRGDKMGAPYDKPGLEKQFSLNDQRFAAHPEVRSQILSSHAHWVDHPASQPGNKKGYAAYTKTSRRDIQKVPTSERELAHSILSADEIRKAKRDIGTYCKENNIALMQNERGHTVLRDKTYIVIKGAEAVNTRNGTRGTLIDFVAAHHRVTLLQAVSKINGSPEPAQFEHHFGSIPRNYTPFHIPKPDQMPFAEATQHLGNFLRSIGAHPKLGEDLFKHQRAEVSKSGLIRLFSEADSKGTLEFALNPKNAWTERVQGSFASPFFQRPPKRDRMTLFLSPKSFLASRGQSLTSHPSRDGLLVLMEPNKALLDHYLTANPGIRRIDLFNAKGRSLFQSELDFFGIMKPQLHARGIELITISANRSLSHDGLSIGI